MSAIKPSAEHMERARRLLVHPMDDLAERVATALAEAEARGRKAAFEEAATWHDEQVVYWRNWEGADRDVGATWPEMECRGHAVAHTQSAITVRTLAAKES